MKNFYFNLRNFIAIKRSGIFDASFYLQEYPDVRKADINPLWHFTRFGWKEGRKPSRYVSISSYVFLSDIFIKYPLRFHSSKTKEEVKQKTNISGKHIEFIGLPGSGKSTLYNQLNLILLKELGYKPGPTYLFLEILKDKKYQSLRGNDWAFLTSFCIKNKSFIKSVINSDRRFQYPEQLNDVRKFIMAYFYTLCTYYQALITSAPNEWIMFDEGFYFHLAWFIIDKNGKIKGKIGRRLLDSMPKVDLLIHVKSNSSTCIKRMRNRKQGIPFPYQKLSESQLEMFFANYDCFLDKFCEVVSAEGIKTIAIDNNQPIKNSKSILSTEITQLINTECNQNNNL